MLLIFGSQNIDLIIYISGKLIRSSERRLVKSLLLLPLKFWKKVSLLVQFGGLSIFFLTFVDKGNWDGLFEWLVTLARSSEMEHRKSAVHIFAALAFYLKDKLTGESFDVIFSLIQAGLGDTTSFDVCSLLEKSLELRAKCLN